MTWKRLILGGLTILAITLMGQDLLNSWHQPQFRSRLELYQTDLVLHLAEWQGSGTDAAPLKQALLSGEDPLKSALTQYQEVRQDTEKALERAKQSPQAAERSPAALPPDDRTGTTIAKQENLRAELILRIGLLQVQQKDVEAGIKTWTQLSLNAPNTANGAAAAVLVGLWSVPPQLLPDAELTLQRNLEGWFRYQALRKLYTLQQRSEAIAALQQTEQTTADQAVKKLALVSTLPAVTGVLGVGLLLFLLGQRLIKGKDALLAGVTDIDWTVPWDGEIIWQVLVGGFFFIGQIVIRQILVPILAGILQKLGGTPIADLSESSRAFLGILLPYLLLAIGTLTVLYISIKPYLPLAPNWFRLTGKGQWWAWGIGGYLVALPLVILVSLANQVIWQGQGGSNPILPIALEGKDPAAMAIFFVTAAIAAPLFEEFLFRGFLLASLTRYFPTWGAIVLSSLIFAVAHLSLSEVIPLMTLGMILGFVYTRSQNLLAPMLLHSLWNGSTLLGLFVLGSGTRG